MSIENLMRKKWVILFLLLFPTFVVSIDNSIVFLALPTISAQLQLSNTMQLWVVDIYSLVMAALLVAGGNIADRLGRKKVLLVSIVGFTIFSIIAAFSFNAYMLLFSRIGLGICAAGISPITLAMIHFLFKDTGKTQLALAIWITTFSAGSAFGTIFGGFLLEHFWWGSIFMIAVPIMIPAIVLLPFLLPETKDDNAGKLDIVAIMLSIVGITCIIYSIKKIALQGFIFINSFVLVLGILALLCFALHLLRQENPMLDLRLFKNKSFTAAILINMIGAISIFGFIFFTTQYLQLVLDIPVLKTAIYMVPSIICTFMAGLYVVKLNRIFKAKTIIFASLILNMLTFLLLSISANFINLPIVILLLALISTGVGFIETITYDMIIACVPSGKTSAASGLTESTYELGIVLGTTCMGSIINWAYTSHIVVPKALPKELFYEVHSSLSLATQAASKVATHIPELAKQILENAREAFTSSISTLGIISFSFLTVSIIVAYFLLFQNQQKQH